LCQESVKQKASLSTKLTELETKQTRLDELTQDVLKLRGDLKEKESRISSMGKEMSSVVANLSLLKKQRDDAVANGEREAQLGAQMKTKCDELESELRDKTKHVEKLKDLEEANKLLTELVSSLILEQEQERGVARGAATTTSTAEIDLAQETEADLTQHQSNARVSSPTPTSMPGGLVRVTLADQSSIKKIEDRQLKDTLSVNSPDSTRPSNDTGFESSEQASKMLLRFFNSMAASLNKNLFCSSDTTLPTASSVAPKARTADDSWPVKNVPPPAKTALKLTCTSDATATALSSASSSSLACTSSSSTGIGSGAAKEVPVPAKTAKPTSTFTATAGTSTASTSTTKTADKSSPSMTTMAVRAQPKTPKTSKLTCTSDATATASSSSFPCTCGTSAGIGGGASAPALKLTASTSATAMSSASSLSSPKTMPATKKNQYKKREEPIKWTKDNTIALFEGVNMFEALYNPDGTICKSLIASKAEDILKYFKDRLDVRRDVKSLQGKFEKLSASKRIEWSELAREEVEKRQQQQQTPFVQHSSAAVLID
jgi:hypothetical protein